MVPKLITYVHTHGFTSEYFMLPVHFPLTEVDHSNVCNSCRGRIGGPRLFCLDCASKSTVVYNTMDLCCAPQCVDARITHHKDFEGEHTPNHRLIKARTPVLTRSEGRIHKGACEAFQRVQVFCMKIAEYSSHLHEESGLREQKTSSSRSASTASPANGVKPDDVHPDPDGTKDGAETKDRALPDAIQGQIPDQDLPTCGKCKGSLSFPFWYCIFCEGRSRG